MTTNTNAIRFRTKFSKHIHCSTEYDVFVSAFKKFIDLEAKTAIDILWRLTCNPCSEALWKIQLDPLSIASEMTSALRNELRYQYAQNHPNFLKVEVTEECSDAYTLLSKNSDEIVAHVVYNRCNTFLYLDEYSITRALFLLNSDKESQYFGGLRSLNFKAEEAEFLKPYHQKIYALLKAMYDVQKSQGAYTSSNAPLQRAEVLHQKTSKELPFTLDKDISVDTKPLVKENVQIVESSFQKESVQENVVFKSIAAESVLEHKNAFFKFAITRDMTCLAELVQLGFDLNQVVAKEMEIKNFLKACTALEV